jgi:hypothetical protein
MLDKTLDALQSCKDLAAQRLADRNLSEDKAKLYKDLYDRAGERIKYLESIKCSEFSVIKIGFFKILSFKKCN